MLSIGIIVGLLLILFSRYFIRVPKINPPISSHNIISPAFGQIIRVEKTDKYVHFCIFLGLLDPHIQYIPYDGILTKTIHKQGEFNRAYIIEKSNHNERMEHTIKTKLGNIYVIQIAGMLARRIYSYIKPGSIVKQGEKLGIIKLGSRVDISIPWSPKIQILKKKGDKVRGGESVLVFVR